MTTRPNPHPANALYTSMPEVCRPLFCAQVDVVLPPPHTALSLAASLARSDPDAARLLR